MNARELFKKARLSLAVVAMVSTGCSSDPSVSIQRKNGHSLGYRQFRLHD